MEKKNNSVILIRLPEEEKKIIERCAKAEGMSVSAYCRKMSYGDRNEDSCDDVIDTVEDTVRVRISVSSEIMRELEKEASSLGLPLKMYIRLRLEKAVREVKPVNITLELGDEQLEEIEEEIYLLNKKWKNLLSLMNKSSFFTNRDKEKIEERINETHNKILDLLNLIYKTREYVIKKTNKVLLQLLKEAKG